MGKIVKCCVILSLFIYSFPSFTASQTIKIGYVEFPPMTYTDNEGNPSGVIIDIASKALEKAGYQWTATPLPAKRLAKMLTNGHIQLWIGLSTLPEFKGKTYIGKSVVKKLQLRAYTIGEKKPILKPEDLVGNTILILRGYSYGGWINFIKNPANQVKYMEFDSHKGAFKWLNVCSDKKPPCYLLNYKHPSDVVLESSGYQNIRYNEISSFDIHFVVTRQMHDAKAVLDKIETAFIEMKQEM